ncbi:MAG: hypothetical protein ACC613_02780 [Synergistales bacterium]|jgi:hypothetical protein
MSVRLTGVARKTRPLAERLGEYLVPRPSSTFIFRLGSSSFLVIDRFLPPEEGCLAVVATEAGGLACRRLEQGFDPSSVWGRVTWILKDPNKE